MKTLAKIIVMLNVVLIVSGCGQISGNSDANSPSFVFAIDGYVEVQPTEIYEIDVRDYLPSKSMELTYLFGENSEVVTIEYIEIIDNQINYYSTSNLVDYSSLLTKGQYYYDDVVDCLCNNGYSLLGNNFDNPYLIPMDKSFNSDTGIALQNISYLFTVTTDSGTYEDCVAVLEEDTSTGKTYTTVTYYAKDIGEVLSVSNYISVEQNNNNNNFVVVNILKEIAFFD